MPAALVALVRRNRRRYGGYLVHAGIAVLFVGVAASSSFQHEREVLLSPGQTARVGKYDVTYVKPTANLRAAPNGGLEKIDLGAQLRVTRDGRKVADMTTVKSYFPSMAPFLGPISRFFEGEATSEVGLKAGWRRDVWTAIAPDIGALRPRIEEGDKVFSGAKLSPEQRNAFLAQALGGLTRSYAKQPAARDVPPDRVADGHLDLDRRADRVPRRDDRAVAAAAGLPRPARAAYAARVGREVRIPARDDRSRDRAIDH